MSKCLNLENHTGQVSLDELFKMRTFFTDAVQKMQKELHQEVSLDASIEGDGFNIAFPIGEKIFSLRVEVDEFWTKFNQKN